MLALFAAGALTDILHRPGPPPEIETTSRATLIVSGCVVEPPVFSDGREHCPGARARSARPRQSVFEGRRSCATLRYGQKVEFEAKLRQEPQFRQTPAPSTTPATWPDRYLLDRFHPGRRSHPILPGVCGSRWEAWLFGLRAAALEKLEKLYAGQPYETGMMQALLIGGPPNGKVWTDDFRRTEHSPLVISARRWRRWRLSSVPVAAVLRSAVMALTVTAMASAVCAGDRLAGPGDPVGRRTHLFS